MTRQMKEMLVKKCHEEYEPVLEALISLAVGIKVRTFNDDGEEVVYDRPPDIYAIREIHDRMFGKAPQAIFMGDLDKVESLTDLVSLAAKSKVYGVQAGTGHRLGSGEEASIDAAGESRVEAGRGSRETA